MGAILEKTIQAEILGWLRGHGYFVWRQNSGTLYQAGRRIQMGAYGTPDICGMTKQGRWLGIEVKTKTGKQTMYQKDFEKACKASKGIYLLARCLTDVLDALGEPREPVSELDALFSLAE